MALAALLAVDRQSAIVAALVGLIASALTVSFGAWVLLAKERRLDRTRLDRTGLGRAGRDRARGPVDPGPTSG